MPAFNREGSCRPPPPSSPLPRFFLSSSLIYLAHLQHLFWLCGLSLSLALSVAAQNYRLCDLGAAFLAQAMKTASCAEGRLLYPEIANAEHAIKRGLISQFEVAFVGMEDSKMERVSDV
jgi:hypothetical protein